jgi:glycogen operon protein
VSAPRTRAADAGVTAGAVLVEGGVAFGAVSRVADRVEVCLLDDDGESRHELDAVGDGRWHGVVAGASAGQRYGLRVHGPFDRARGLYCEPDKLLLDPYARAFTGRATDRRAALAPGSGEDTNGLVPASVVVDEEFEWGDDEAVRPRHPWSETVVYEVHVRGATQRHPDVPDPVRGTYLGVGDDAFVAHLRALGVTTVELLPVHELVDEAFLVESGKTNYWGYNPVGWFAPAARYAADVRPGAQVNEFKSMVRTLHAHQLEVVLDVVYNHTAEGDEHGPTLSLRGLDAPSYYRLNADGHLVDTTGCGNSLNAASTDATALVLDSLRYWVEACHVDGFRFDLAPTLGRARGPFDPRAPLLAAMAEDPVLSGCKLICEPWDLRTDDSYALGRFTAPFREWNGRYRDAVRDFWRGRPGSLEALARSAAGSLDLFDPATRPVPSSINYVTSHDGFTLRDLVSYARKHNGANGQGNEDGTDDNRSWNGGVEGETDDAAVVALRRRDARALLATLVASRGVPMLLGGDELWRTQGGNNNAYCQDNETSWLDWSGERLDRFITACLALRRAHPALTAVDAEVAWWRPDGVAMSDDDWADETARCVAMRATATADGRHDDVLVAFNGHEADVDVTLPADAAFVEVLSSYDEERGGYRHEPGATVAIPARSVLVFEGTG